MVMRTYKKVKCGRKPYGELRTELRFSLYGTKVVLSTFTMARPLESTYARLDELVWSTYVVSPGPCGYERQSKNKNKTGCTDRW